jgi:hypothetical protein
LFKYDCFLLNNIDSIKGCSELEQTLPPEADRLAGNGEE